MNKFQEIYQDIINYFIQNYVNLGLTFLFLIIGFILVNFLKSKLKTRLLKKSDNPITITFISQIISYSLKLIIILISLYSLGLNDITSGILASAGVITFIVGFAFKDIGENFLAGIILAFKSPFRVNDLIESGNIHGYVKDINIRETIIKTPDGKDVFLPNSIILKTPLFNYTIDGYLRYEFIVGLDYGDDISLGIKTILDTVNKIDGVLKGDKKAAVVINELTTNTINIKVLFWIDTFQSTSRTFHHSIRSHVMNDVVIELTKKGFYLPANIVEIKNYKQDL
ncbi:MAG: mechanosensitive ion channel family protein [Flavobacteriales bacterium]|nr:mechanosensitive ion channel family protein [Flavobacteriales bacterium]MCW8912322.1 mechanosensitive ion channel family protein [Flavobacteriales bacterium]MCW8938053.1 mechanosensitive ion channel family protein [Flavobacteriales bacterium]MCW8940506.1 mechanosensitive ion channel family protein [Flavobacteriales bacterium]MCW8968386.1 mechanosensitive ion channel family protein [Flavobacteriales bacterium]